MTPKMQPFWWFKPVLVPHWKLLWKDGFEDPYGTSYWTVAAGLFRQDAGYHKAGIYCAFQSSEVGYNTAYRGFPLQTGKMKLDTWILLTGIVYEGQAFYVQLHKGLETVVWLMFYIDWTVGKHKILWYNGHDYVDTGLEWNESEETWQHLILEIDFVSATVDMWYDNGTGLTKATSCGFSYPMPSIGANCLYFICYSPAFPWYHDEVAVYSWGV
jgi:hypothetical protein